MLSRQSLHAATAPMPKCRWVRRPGLCCGCLLLHGRGFCLHFLCRYRWVFTAFRGRSPFVACCVADGCVGDSLSRVAQRIRISWCQRSNHESSPLVRFLDRLSGLRFRRRIGRLLALHFHEEIPFRTTSLSDRAVGKVEMVKVQKCRRRRKVHLPRAFFSAGEETAVSIHNTVPAALDASSILPVDFGYNLRICW